MLGLEIQRGKDDVTVTKYIDEVWLKTSACTMRLVESTTCQRLDAGAAHDVSKNYDATNDCFLGDLWVGSVPTALGLKKVLQHPTDLITQIKTAHAHYPRKFLESSMKNWPSPLSIEWISVFFVFIRWKKITIFFYGLFAIHKYQLPW